MADWPFRFWHQFCYCMYASGYARVRFFKILILIQACDNTYHVYLDMANIYGSNLLDLTQWSLLYVYSDKQSNDHK